MKQKVINPEGIEPVAQDKTCDNAVSHAADEMDTLNIYLLPYSYPFMPMMDVTIVFDELRKMVNNWLFSRRERGVIYKRKIHETI